MKVLVFPCNTFEAICYAKELVAEGNTVIGACSVDSEYNIEDTFTNVFYLPHIKDDAFKNQFTELCIEQNIEMFWTSISAVYRVTAPFLEDLSVARVSCHPADQPFISDDVVRAELNERKHYISSIQANFKSELSENLIHSILKNTFSVSGQSHLDKLLTLCCIYNMVPRNTDVVEIGSLWGRTAKLFDLLNKVYSVGNLLCIDPWPVGGMSQATHQVLDSYSRVFDGEKYFSIFCSNLMANGQGTINYIRDFSNAGIHKYLNADAGITTPEFGHTSYCKKIGLLHVDGNHKFEDVVEDIDNFAPLVVSGGWIVFDDYNWPYGDGVTRAADSYISENHLNIDVCFYSGGALFVRLK